MAMSLKDGDEFGRNESGTDKTHDNPCNAKRRQKNENVPILAVDGKCTKCENSLTMTTSKETFVSQSCSTSNWMA